MITSVCIWLSTSRKSGSRIAEGQSRISVVSLVCRIRCKKCCIHYISRSDCGYCYLNWKRFPNRDFSKLCRMWLQSSCIEKDTKSHNYAENSHLILRMNSGIKVELAEKTCYNLRIISG